MKERNKSKRGQKSKGNLKKRMKNLKKNIKNEQLKKKKMKMVE